MPAHDNGSIQLYQASLTTREQREFVRAERTIARGLKSFLAVGMALKEIRDKRLYRQQYDTFEEYCIRRWDFSRIRAYQICAASEVAASLSTIVNIPLPENEAQTRPLTRLKDPAQWRRAWQAAVKVAAAEKRPVTARDTEEAVQRLNGNGRIELAWEDVARSVYESQDKILLAIQKLHCSSGFFELDATYGNGGFWENLPRPKLCFDLMPTAPFVKKGDFRHLPLENCAIASMVLDLPFLCYIRANKGGIMNDRFSGYWTYEELLNDYSAAISEAFRILKRGGTLTFKCQDTVHNHTLQLTHGRVWLMAEKKGFRLKDLFVLVAPNRLPIRAASHGRQTQRHARVFHCYFLVFQKL